MRPPLLMILGEEDELVPTSLNLEFFARAGEPKEVLTYHGNHYAAYDDPAIHELAAHAARDWFLKYLA